MDDSEKALALAYISHQKFERYAGTIVEQLKQNDFVMGKESYWQRLKTELRTNPSAPDTGVDYFAERCCSELLRGLFPEELRLLWLGTDAADKAGPHAFFRPRHASHLAGELYRQVKYQALGEARNEAERQAWFASTPNELELPVSITSDEIVIPLADFLVNSDLVRDINSNLEKRMVCNSLPEGRDHEETEKALRELLDNHSDFILPEDLEDAMGLPRNERGECLFDRLMTNTSTGWRDQDMFYWSR